MADETARLMNRFVRPIYDAIDNRQYKVAIKHCMHKKVAHLDIVLVLKAHCLERTGKTDEALEICRAVQRRKPTDDTLLNTMNLVFKLAGCEHEMLPTFEYACAHVEPPNEELYASLFFSYARRGEFLKQQQTALKMFKAFGGVKYMSWASLSMMLQVQHGGAPAKMLALAERMQLKTLRDLKSTDGEALQLLVRIMQLQDKHADALSAFDEFAAPLATATSTTSERKQTPNGRSAEGEGAYEEDIELGPMLTIDRLVLEASLATAVNDFDRASRVYEELLEHHSADDWAFLTAYIDVRLSLDDDNARVEAHVRSFLTQLQARTGNEQLRGPRLAVLHLLSKVLARLHAANASPDALARVETELEAHIVQYIDRFFTKTCCFSDLQQYFALFVPVHESDAVKSELAVSAAARTRLVERIVAMADASVSAKSSEDESDRRAALAQLQRRLLALKALRFLGYYDDAQKFPVAKLEAIVDGLVVEYDATAWLNVGATGGQREVQNTDNLLLLAAHFLLDAYQRASTSESVPARRALLVRAAALLEYGLAHSAYNFQMKLLLARVYAYLGAGDAMLARHAELDVKHVQLDSLAFLVLDKLLQLGHFPEARRLIDSISRMHRSTANDTPEYIARSYKTGVYSKVMDMTQFLYAKMRQSHTLAIGKSEALVLGLFDAVSSGPSKLHDHVASQAFDASISDLDALLAKPDALSQNQHRDVIVRWTRAPTVPTGDTFAHDSAALVECDRSATFASSVLWLQLHATAAKLLRSAGVADETASLEPLAQQYAATVAQLQLTSSSADAPTLQQQVWQWSVDAVHASIALIAATNGDADTSKLATVPAAISALQTQLAAIAAAVPAALVTRTSEASDIALSPHGIATLSLIVGECGLWTLCLLSLALRVASKKKSRKDDAFVASVSGLRALLKQLHDVYASLEAHVSALKLASDSDSSKHDAASLAGAERKVAANVRASYATTQSRMTQLLRDRVAFTKAK